METNKTIAIALIISIVIGLSTIAFAQTEAFATAKAKLKSYINRDLPVSEFTDRVLTNIGVEDFIYTISVSDAEQDKEIQMLEDELCKKDDTYAWCKAVEPTG